MILRVETIIHGIFLQRDFVTSYSGVVHVFFTVSIFEEFVVNLYLETGQKRTERH